MFSKIISQAERNSRTAVKRKPGDFFGDGSRLLYRGGKVCKDGSGNPLTDRDLLYCGACGGLKQWRVYAPFLDRIIEPYVLCECEQKAEGRESGRIAEENRQRRISANLSQADSLMLKNTFSADKYPESSAGKTFRDYCRRWHEYYKPKNLGLYIYGGVGTGKTFYASCIANEIAREYTATVRALSVTKAVNDLFSTDDKSGYIDELAGVDLLILDDFGAQRRTDYASEVMFSIIDERYKAQKPLILTSNLDYAELQKHRSTDRVYDRVIDMCIPFPMTGSSMRGVNI